jgi:cell division protein FtsL
MDDDEFVDAREAKDWLTEVMTLNREIRKKDETIKEQKRELNKLISQVKDLEWEMDEKRKEFKRIISQKED